MFCPKGDWPCWQSNARSPAREPTELVAPATVPASARRRPYPAFLDTKSSWTGSAVDARSWATGRWLWRPGICSASGARSDEQPALAIREGLHVLGNMDPRLPRHPPLTGFCGGRRSGRFPRLALWGPVSLSLSITIAAAIAAEGSWPARGCGPAPWRRGAVFDHQQRDDPARFYAEGGEQVLSGGRHWREAL